MCGVREVISFNILCQNRAGHECKAVSWQA